MYNTAHFSRMPRTSLPGTRMKKPQIAAGTCFHGKIIPLFCNMVMPGQIDSNIANGVIWMSSPIAPIVSQIKGSINCFFVPMRLVWEHTKQFFGENDSSYGPQTTQYKIPAIALNTEGATNTQVVVNSVSHYLHKPLYRGTGEGQPSNSADPVLVSILKERAYWLVCSEFYRHEQIQNPVLLNKGDTAAIGTLDGNTLTVASMPYSCLKDFDAFTTTTLSPSYGGQVLLPINGFAPIVSMKDLGYDADDVHTITNPWLGTSADLTGTNSYRQLLSRMDASGNPQIGLNTLQTGSVSANVDATNLVADLKNATATTIDDLYTAMAANAWYHNANFGSRYFETTAIHYGVSNPDLVLDRPEHISEFKFDIAIQEVVSTAGAANDSSSKLGQPGAVSKTYIRKKLYNHSFGEWGFVIGLLNTYHQRYYSAGVLKEDLAQDLFDLYFPEFANRGDDVVPAATLWLGSSSSMKKGFGFQEAYYDRRYYEATVTAQLDPYAGSSALGRWVLADAWSSEPTLSESFLQENRDAIKDALVSGSSGPDYVYSFNFEHTEILPMPAYSKPGIPSFGRGLV